MGGGSVVLEVLLGNIFYKLTNNNMNKLQKGQVVRITQGPHEGYAARTLDADDMARLVELQNGTRNLMPEIYLTPIPRTLETLFVGDVVVDKDGDERTVLGVAGRVYLLSCPGYPDGASDVPSTADDLKRNGYKILNHPTPLTDADTDEMIAELERRGLKIIKE